MSNTRFTFEKAREQTIERGNTLPRDTGSTVPALREALTTMLEDERWTRRMDWGAIEGDIEVYTKVRPRVLLSVWLAG